MLGPAWTALAGAVLPLHHLGAERVALGPLPGPLQPPRLARLLQQRSPRGQRGGVVQGPGFAARRRQLPAWRDRESIRAGQMEGSAGTAPRPCPRTLLKVWPLLRGGRPMPFSWVPALLPSHPGDASSVLDSKTGKCGPVKAQLQLPILPWHSVPHPHTSLARRPRPSNLSRPQASTLVFLKPRPSHEATPLPISKAPLPSG